MLPRILYTQPLFGEFVCWTKSVCYETTWHSRVRMLRGRLHLRIASLMGLCSVDYVSLGRLFMSSHYRCGIKHVVSFNSDVNIEQMTPKQHICRLPLYTVLFVIFTQLLNRTDAMALLKEAVRSRVFRWKVLDAFWLNGRESCFHNYVQILHELNKQQRLISFDGDKWPKLRLAVQLIKTN